jgi:hypothetical protein
VRLNELLGLNVGPNFRFVNHGLVAKLAILSHKVHKTTWFAVREREPLIELHNVADLWLGSVWRSESRRWDLGNQWR